MKKILFLAVIFASTILIFGCKKQSEQWMGFYYPQGMAGQVSAGCEIKEFATKAVCDEWGKSLKSNAQADHYCGYKCNYDDSCQYACMNPE